MKQIHHLVSLAFISLTILFTVATTSHAAMIININEIGDDVVFTGSGTINLTGLSIDHPATPARHGVVGASMGLAVAFPYLSNPVNIYTGFTGAADLGVGANIVTDFVTGTHNFGLNLDFGWIYLDQGYVSGEQLDFTITVPDQTLASLGFTQGSFNINWASDSMQIETSPDPPPVPEPATMLLLGGGIAGLAGLRRRATTV